MIHVSQDSADQLFMDAVKAKMLDNREEAFRKYSLFAAAQPANATAHYELSRLWFERNNVARALTEARIALQGDSTNKWILKQYADLLTFDEQYVAAARIYDKIAARDRAPEEYLMRESMLYQKAKHYEEALGTLDKLARYIGADDESLLQQRQQIYLNMNNVEGAAAEGRKLIAFYPAEPHYRLLLAELYDNNNMPEKAAAAYREAEEKFPDDVSVQLAMVQYYLRKKDMPHMEAYLGKAVMNQSVSTEDRIGLLAPFIQYRGADSASRKIVFDLTRKLAQQEPLQPQAISLYGDVLVTDGQFEEALKQYKKVISIDSLNYTSWQQVMYLHSMKQQNDSLIALSERAARIFPKEPMVFYLGGIGYMQEKKNDMAIRFFKKAVEQTKNNDDLLSDVLLSLGDIYNTEGHFKSSDSCYRAALKLQPNNAMALNNFSYYLSVRGENLDEAEKMSAKSLKLRPEESTFLDTYGWILYRQGKYKEAKPYIQRAIDLNKDNADPTLWEHLGDVEYKLGNTEGALEYWNTALSKGERSESLQKKINEKKLHD
ncbi:tetratricopeptide repeat protein [Taibaiella koreensis]|uniref:tetratricopeptide repeat protein n=1 Tax=Taibaiella koreensis TaxID=1268548 RepID=UPI0013C3119E|nr:tetratricopeptide repeat protein [Taibaiella koreensis]